MFPIRMRPGGVAVTPAFRMTLFGDGSIANAIDDAQFFVTQHYRDFLSREPDAAGLSFWTNEINSCGTDVGCIDFKRQNVSAAYFLSIEFQETGFYAIRLQRAAFGKNRVTRRVFTGAISDGRGCGRRRRDRWTKLVNATARTEQTELCGANCFQLCFYFALSDIAFSIGFCKRAVCIGRSRSHADELQNAITAFGAGDTAGRTAALRKIAESNSVTQAELNPSFVLMQYFGYLRRDPDTSGYDFWLNKLEQFNGNYIQAEMVKSFLVSGEYRGRFPANSRTRAVESSRRQKQ